jgi:hypothetical protein
VQKITDKQRAAPYSQSELYDEILITRFWRQQLYCLSKTADKACRQRASRLHTPTAHPSTLRQSGCSMASAFQSLVNRSYTFTTTTMSLHHEIDRTEIDLKVLSRINYDFAFNTTEGIGTIKKPAYTIQLSKQRPNPNRAHLQR